MNKTTHQVANLTFFWNEYWENEVYEMEAGHELNQVMANLQSLLDQDLLLSLAI